jgi:hypothetical protein
VVFTPRIELGLLRTGYRGRLSPSASKKVLDHRIINYDLTAFVIDDDYVQALTVNFYIFFYYYFCVFICCLCCRIEKMFAYQLNSAQGPMPFVMAWSPGTSTHLFRLATTHPYFDKNMLIKNSIFPATTRERGDPLGSGGRFMEYRSNNFGPPLFCNNKHSFYHLDNRLNKSGLQHDTQWLFPRDRFAKRGRAFSEEVSMSF